MRERIENSISSVERHVVPARAFSREPVEGVVAFCRDRVRLRVLLGCSGGGRPCRTRENHRGSGAGSSPSSCPRIAVAAISWSKLEYRAGSWSAPGLLQIGRPRSPVPQPGRVALELELVRVAQLARSGVRLDDLVGVERAVVRRELEQVQRPQQRAERLAAPHGVDDRRLARGKTREAPLTSLRNAWHRSTTWDRERSRKRAIAPRLNRTSRCGSAASRSRSPGR